jgi:hypothetical protein
MIEVDTADFKADTIREGQVPVILHVFKIRNTGDSVLLIKNVRAGWGCAAVGSDSTILPGREGSITAEISTRHLYEGDFRKSITVTSNAKNKPSLTLSIAGYYKTVLEVEPHPAIRLSAAKESDTGVVVRIRTSKKFKVEKVEFKFKEGERGMDWETVLPLRFTCTFVELGKTAKKKDDRKRYKGKPIVCEIKLFHTPKLIQDKWGDFHIYTNLKEKKVITIPGMMEAKK